jgi:predicted dehydrogenase
VALCDLDHRRIKRALDISGEARPRVFTNYRALLDWQEVDAVVLATPVHLHGEQTQVSLAAGKHVYCEKPMALSLGEAKEVLAACRAAESRGQVYQSGLQRRYSPRYRESVRRVQMGEFGRPLFVRAQWHAVSSPPREKPWLWRVEKSGGMVLEQASHQFDVFNWVFGSRPLAACGAGGSLEGPLAASREGMDHYGLVLEYPRGGKVHFSHLNFAVPERRFAGIYELVFCEHGGIDLANALAWDRSGKARELATGRGSDTQLAVDGFVASVLSGQRPEADAEVGYGATLAALLGQKALDGGGRVSLSALEAS